MYDRNFDKGSKKEEEEEKFSDSKPRHFPRKWPRQKQNNVYKTAENMKSSNSKQTHHKKYFIANIILHKVLNVFYITQD